MDKEKISIGDNEGAIVIRESGEPELYAPIAVGEACDRVRFLLAFLLYATENKEWFEEFDEVVSKLETKFKQTKSELVALERRSKFKVVQDDEETD
tara:strand:- start:1575 stop:1862 length:288 start_codon:yes stop_codon:yes gene_type:complete